MTDSISSAACTSVVADASGGRYFIEHAACTIGPDRLVCTDLAPRTAFGWITTPAPGGS
jgi:hypothetical protein